MQENRTAAMAATTFAPHGYEVTTGVGKTGVVGLLRNGDGPTVMLRADMDALPVAGGHRPATMPARSRPTDREGNTVPVTHACGHDMHVAWLMGATTLFAQRARCLARHADGCLPAGRGDGARRAGDDRRRAVQRAFPSLMSCSASTSWSGPPALSRARRRRSPPPPTACRSACSGAARTARCRRPASILSSWRQRPCCGCKPSFPAKSPPTEAAVVTVGVAAGRHEGKRHPRRGHHQAERPHIR